LKTALNLALLRHDVFGHDAICFLNYIHGCRDCCRSIDALFLEEAERRIKASADRRSIDFGYFDVERIPSDHPASTIDPPRALEKSFQYSD